MKSHPEESPSCIQQRWCKNIHNTGLLTIFFLFIIFMLYAFPGGQWPLGLVLPLLVFLSEKQATKSALHAPGPGAAGRHRLAPQALRCDLRQWSAIPQLYPPLTPTSKLLHRLNLRPPTSLNFHWAWPQLRPAWCQRPIQEPHEAEAATATTLWAAHTKVLFYFDSRWTWTWTVLSCHTAETWATGLC